MNKVKYIAVCVALIGSVASANLITNGDLESGMTNWAVVEEPGSSIRTNALAQSPFTSGTQGMRFLDATGTSGMPAGTPNATVDFGTLADGVYTLAFDYRKFDVGTGSWTYRVYNNDNAIAFGMTILTTGVQLSGAGGNVWAVSGGTTKAKMDTWYHMEVTLDTVNKKFLNFSHTDGITTNTLAEVAGYNVASAGLDRLAILDVTGNTVALSLDMDNLSLIPEPATIGMLGLGAFVALFVRRKLMV